MRLTGNDAWRIDFGVILLIFYSSCLQVKLAIMNLVVKVTYQRFEKETTSQTVTDKNVPSCLSQVLCVKNILRIFLKAFDRPTIKLFLEKWKKHLTCKNTKIEAEIIFATLLIASMVCSYYFFMIDLTSKFNIF